MGTGDAQDNTVKTVDVQIVNPDSIEDKPAFSTFQQSRRTSQQSVLPGAVASRLLGNIINSSAAGLGNGTFAQFIVPNSTTFQVNFTISDRQGRTIVAFPDTAIFMGVTVTLATQWPNASFGMSNFPISINPGNWGLTNNVNSVTSVTMRNNSGADQPVIAVCRWRIITQPSEAFKNLN